MTHADAASLLAKSATRSLGVYKGVSSEMDARCLEDACRSWLVGFVWRKEDWVGAVRRVEFGLVEG